MRDLQADLLKRASLWVLGQALPDAHALRAPARLALTSVVVASAAGTLVALSVVAALIGLYMYLVNQGVSPGASLIMVGALGAISGMVAYLLARRQAEQIPSHLDDLKLFTPHNNDLLGNLFNMVVGGFLEGVSQKPEATASSSQKLKSREEIEAAIEEMMDALEKLEAEAEDAMEDAEAKIVVEIERHKKRPHKS